MSTFLKIVLFIFLLFFGARIIYYLGDLFRPLSATGRDVSLLVATLFVLIYWGSLVWYFFVR